MPVDEKPVRKALGLRVNPNDRNGPPLAKFSHEYVSHFATCTAKSPKPEADAPTTTKPAEQASTEEPKTDA
jgi:hypothetical protein